MIRLIMCKGLPASGKTTWARQYVRENPSMRKIVCRDDLRRMMDDGVWSSSNEKTIIKIEQSIVRSLLYLEKTVIVCDTNLSPKNESMWKEIALECGAEFMIKDFTNVPFQECIRRDSLRQGNERVGEAVIMRMHNQFLEEDIYQY